MGMPIKQPPFHNVNPGQVCNIPNLDMGDTCDSLILKLTGNIQTGTAFNVEHLEWIKVKLGGKSVVDSLSGDEFQILNTYVDRVTNVTYLKIQFSDDVARTVTGENMGGIDTSLGYSSFTMEIKLAAGSGGGNPGLECWQEISAPKADNDPYKAMFRAYLKANAGFQSAADHNLTPPLGSADGNVLIRMHIFTPNDAIDRINVKKNGVEIQGDGEKGLIDFMHGLKRTAQAGHIAFDPTFTNNQSDAITTVRQSGRPATFQFRGLFSQAEDITYISELYTVLQRI